MFFSFPNKVFVCKILKFSVKKRPSVIFRQNEQSEKTDYIMITDKCTGGIVAARFLLP